MALTDASPTPHDVDSLFRRQRIRVMPAITHGCGFIYTCPMARREFGELRESLRRLGMVA